MSFDPSRHYADGPLQRLLQRELAMIAPILDGVFGVWGLHVRPHPAAPSGLPPHLLNAIVELAVDDDGGLAGAARCEPWHLPFASESFKLVVAQHVVEQCRAPDEVIEELTRVLAPEGVALVFGFNPASLWRPWLSNRLDGRWTIRGAAAWRGVLGRQLDVLQVRYSGLLSPWSAPAAAADAASVAGWSRSLGRFGGSWLLLARKRRSTLTPLRLSSSRADLKLNPSLVPGARRECA